MNDRGPLGKPLGGADLPPREKLPYEWFVEKITLLESRVSSLETKLLMLQLVEDQHRIALSNTVDSIENGLTMSPYPFPEALQKEWDEHCKIGEQMVAKATEAHRRQQARAAVPPDGHKDKTLPH